MPNSPVIRIVEHLRKTVLRRDEDTLSDGQLLDRFLETRDEAAFAALVRRHGPMVWGVCRRIVGQAMDAEDAFQAAFLILVRKAASVKPRAAVGNWLYGVACRAALKARADSYRVRAKEKQVTSMPEPAKEPRDDPEALQKLLDQELSALPDKYRLPVVLCDLEGRTRKEVAAQLKIPEGTLSSRLATAHQMLSKRLARHGLAVSGGSLAALFAQSTASACVPAAVISSTIKTATLVAASNGAVAGVVSTKVAALTEGVMKAMLLTKLKQMCAVVLILGFMVSGVTFLTYCAAAAQGDKARGAEDRVNAPQKPEKEGFTAWGKEVGGLQAGLGYHPGQKRAYSHGETVTLVVRVRNVGNQNVKFQCYYPYFTEIPPTITDGGGKPFVIEKVKTFGLPVLDTVELAAGKEIQLAELKFNLKPVSKNGVNERNLPGVLKGTGKFQIHYGQLAYEGDLGKLATGKLELELKFDPAPATEKKEPQKQERDDPDVNPMGNAGRPVHSLVGHQERLTSVAYAPDGQSIATAAWDGKVRIWDAKTGKEERRLDVPATRDYNPASLSQILFSSDNEFIVTAQQAAPNESGVIVWKRSTGEKVREYRGCIAALSPDGKHIACGERDVTTGFIRLYEFATGKVVREMRGLQSRIDLLTFSPDGKTLFSQVGIPRPHGQRISNLSKR